MPFFKFAIIVICVVMVLAPICIYIMIKHGSLDSARERFRKQHRFLYPSDHTDDD